MKAPDFVCIYHNFAPDDYCDRMIERHKHLESSTSAWRGEDDNNGLRARKDYAFMFDIEAKDLAVETNAILDEALKKYIDEYPSSGMEMIYSNSIKVQRTPPKGGFHTWHCEHGYGHGSHLRTLTWTIYLNDVPDGEGETEFLEIGVKVQPKKGLVSIFPAAWTHTHRGNPVYTEDKYIATGWYYLSD